MLAVRDFLCLSENACVERMDLLLRFAYSIKCSGVFQFADR